MARTMEAVELWEQEREALAVLVQSQWRLIMVRGAQVAESQSWQNEQDKYISRVEQEHERAELKLEERERELAASRAEALAYSGAIDKQGEQINRLRAELDEYRALVREGKA